MQNFQNLLFSLIKIIQINKNILLMQTTMDQKCVQIEVLMKEIKEINSTFISVLEHLGYSSFLEVESSSQNQLMIFKAYIYNLLNMLPSQKVLSKCVMSSTNDFNKRQKDIDIIRPNYQNLNINLGSKSGMPCCENQELVLQILNQTLGISENFAGMASILYRNSDDSQQQQSYPRYGGIFTQSDFYSLQRYFRKSYEKINEIIGIFGEIKFTNLEFCELKDEAVMSCLQHFTYIFEVQKAQINPFKKSHRKANEIQKLKTKVNTNASSSEQSSSQKKSKGQYKLKFKNMQLNSFNPQETCEIRKNEQILQLQSEVKKLQEIISFNNSQFSNEIKRYNFKLYQLVQQVQAYEKEIEELDSQIFILERQRKQDQMLIQALHGRLQDVDTQTRRINFIKKKRGCKSSTQFQLQYQGIDKNQFSNCSNSNQENYSIKDDHSSLYSLKISKVQSYGPQYIEQKFKIMQQEQRKARQLVIVQEDLQQSYSPLKVRLLNKEKSDY